MDYRLGIDLGSCSLGWCMLELKDGHPVRTINLGVRIFSDGRDAKSLEPLSVSRRNARSMRRRRDRYLRRRQKLLNALMRHGLLPPEPDKAKALEKHDPYVLRTKALDQQISLHELGRVLFHLNQRRGFKSNRIHDRKNKEKGAINEGIHRLKESMLSCGARTLGEFLFKTNSGLPVSEHHHKKPSRLKPNPLSARISYEMYTQRQMYKDEFNLIWWKQSSFYPCLTELLRITIEKIIFDQRPLRKKKQEEIGRCTFETDQPRAHWALPLTQRFRMLQDLNHLCITDGEGEGKNLSAQQRGLALSLLENKDKITFKTIRKKLKLSENDQFNLQGDKKDFLWGNVSASVLADENGFGQSWWQLPNDQQARIVKKLLDEESPDELIAWLQNECRLSYGNAQFIADNSENIPGGYCKLSEKAIHRILPFLEEGHIYSEACRLAGYNHSDLRPGHLSGKLPYYGEALPHKVIGGTKDPQDKQNEEKFYGKINNPSVHIALNQLRKFINTLIEVYGRPHEIVIELARDLKLPHKKLEELNRLQAQNQRTNERIDSELNRIGVKPNAESRLKYKLWEELGPVERRNCPFTGRKVTESDLFSPGIEIEHILPFSRTFDDTTANKIIAFRQANQDKGDRSPWEAFGHNSGGYRWEEIRQRAIELPANKRWRFEQTAMEKFSKENRFIERQLNDTKYMSRTAKEYLLHICPNVSCIPGMLTSKLRHHWGVNLSQLLGLPYENDMKKREDHRHHAVDAFVVACTSRSLLQAISRATSSLVYENKVLKNVPYPLPDFQAERSALIQLLNQLAVSHKPDHKGLMYPQGAQRKSQTACALHNDTAYGGRIDPSQPGIIWARHRVKLLDLDDKEKIGKIIDPGIKKALLELASTRTDLKNVLSAYGHQYNIRNVRIEEKKGRDTLVGIKNHAGKVYKYFASDGNYCAEIYTPAEGKDAGKWLCEVITNFQAHQAGFRPNWQKQHPTGKLIMRLFINDLVAWEEGNQTGIFRLKKIGLSENAVYFEAHSTAKNEKQPNGIKKSSKQLKELSARKISVDIIGRVRDPIKKHPYGRAGNNEQQPLPKN